VGCSARAELAEIVGGIGVVDRTRRKAVQQQA
jgi:hypothetical protein